MMNFFIDWLQKQGQEIVTQPLSHKVAGMQEAYIRTEGLNKLGWRVIRRKIYLFFTGQHSLMKDKADASWKKGLWIYVRTAQIGDSLMDLAARDFFNSKDCRVDLLTHEKLKDLYEDDEWFDHVTSDVNSLKAEDYDFVIIQSVHHRALKAKVQFYKSKPWLCMQGFYDVPDFARAPWGAQRLMDFWSIQNYKDLERLGTQKLSSQRLVSYENKITDITIVLGGVDPVRTYPHWDQVLQSLGFFQKKAITLIGTGEVAELNGQAILDLKLNLKIRNMVNQLSLSECIDELARTKLLVVADGGAMHLGVAVQVPQMVSLFIKEIPPNLRIPNRYHEHAIVSNTGFIKDIDPNQIAKKIEYVLAGETI